MPVFIKGVAKCEGMLGLCAETCEVLLKTNEYESDEFDIEPVEGWSFIPDEGGDVRQPCYRVYCPECNRTREAMLKKPVAAPVRRRVRKGAR